MSNVFLSFCNLDLTGRHNEAQIIFQPFEDNLDENDDNQHVAREMGIRGYFVRRDVSATLVYLHLEQ